LIFRSRKEKVVKKTSRGSKTDGMDEKKFVEGSASSRLTGMLFLIRQGNKKFRKGLRK